jgi:hypothetical protein
MPLMTDAEKRDALAAFSAHRHADGVAVTKQMLRDAIDAVDAFMDAQAATIRQQIDPGTRALLTPPQTRVLIRSIMQARYG